MADGGRGELLPPHETLRAPRRDHFAAGDGARVGQPGRPHGRLGLPQAHGRRGATLPVGAHRQPHGEQPVLLRGGDPRGGNPHRAAPDQGRDLRLHTLFQP